MTSIRYATMEDCEFWFMLDNHLSFEEYQRKVLMNQAYILLLDTTPIGILRYQLFGDSIPFCTLLFISSNYHRMGYGKELMLSWEKDMKRLGHGMVLVSTQIDEEAQHFYRKIGYNDAGYLDIDIPNYAQERELFLVKQL